MQIVSLGDNLHKMSNPMVQSVVDPTADPGVKNLNPSSATKLLWGMIMKIFYDYSPLPLIQENQSLVTGESIYK